MCCYSNAYDQNQVEGLATYDNCLYPYRAGTYDQNRLKVYLPEIIACIRTGLERTIRTG